MKRLIPIGIALTTFFFHQNLVIAQATGNNTYNALNYLGWNTTGGPLPFSIGGTAATPLMLLTTGGNLGVGNTFTPAFKLDVDAGDINLNTASTRYRINGAEVLWHNGIPSCIYVGVGAGNSTTGITDNTFVGNAAGNLNTANENTFIGSQAGANNTGGSGNTFVGRYSGNKNVTGNGNTLVGYEAGFNQNTSNAGQNSFVGSTAGYKNLDGAENSYLGQAAGYSNQYGKCNTMSGSYSGYNNTVDSNSFFGLYA